MRKIAFLLCLALLFSTAFAQGEMPRGNALEDILQALCTQRRPMGSQAERDAAQYLQEELQGMGYEVRLQQVPNGDGAEGSNVIAVKPAQSDADILILSAHHDSVPTSFGANDNASGVAALLAAAQALAAVPSDTELRVISFTGEEDGKVGSRYYVQSLSQQERERIIGDIQFDMLGGLGGLQAQLYTVDGESNWLVDCLLAQDDSLSLGAEAASDHTSFQMAGIPSVLVTQKNRGYLYHSVADVAGQVDCEAIAAAVAPVVAAVSAILTSGASSPRALQRQEGDGYALRQNRQSVIYFGQSREETEAFLGAAGTLVESNRVQGDGWTDLYETYRYSMRWFGGEAPMNTDYNYRNGFLESVTVLPGETGYTWEQTRALLYATYGQPQAADGDGEGWADEIYGKYIQLSPSAETFSVSISPYSLGLSNVLATYAVNEGCIETQQPAHAQIWAFVCSILPRQALEKISEFVLFTDGYSNILAYTAPIKAQDGTVDNTRFSICVDYYDVYDENGETRDPSKLVYTILHEYGHALLEDETQVDLSRGESTHDPATFVPGSLRARFYERFWAQTGGVVGVEDYEQNPDHYVSRYGANYFHEDIADTFAVFVLGEKPQGDSVAEQKLLFFWNEEAMVRLREAIRENAGLS